MSQERAVFGVRDSSTFTGGLGEPTAKKYSGPERRRENRRKCQDRRGDVRFDLNDSDRREKDGRREGDAAPKFW